jgi:acetyltransferase-like isoleucine patch superfamily enzyme
MRSLFRKIQTKVKAVLAGVQIGRKTWIHSQAVLETREGSIVLGDFCEVHRGVQLLAYGGHIRIGNFCSINPGCLLYGHGGLNIGNDVRIAAGTIIVPANHNFEDGDRLIREQGETCLGVTIGNDIWLGAHAIVLDGVTVADGCVIGAGSVVTKSTEPYGIYVGNPARRVKERKSSVFEADEA